MTLFQKSQTKGKTKTSTSACSFFAARFFDDERDFTLVLSANNIGIAPLTSLRLGFLPSFARNFWYISYDLSKQSSVKWFEQRKAYLGISVRLTFFTHIARVLAFDGNWWYDTSVFVLHWLEQLTAPQCGMILQYSQHTWERFFAQVFLVQSAFYSYSITWSNNHCTTSKVLY